MEQEKRTDKQHEENQVPKYVWLVLSRVWRVFFAAFKIAFGAAATVALIFVICAFVFMGLLGDYLQDDILPDALVDIEGFDLEQNSYIHYVDGNGNIQEYQKIFAETSSKWAEYDDIPEHLINAAIAIEDHRFSEHQGVDWITTIKATGRMFFGNSSAGGSSITQQLIKNLLLGEDQTADDVTVQRKMMEIFRALKVEKQYDKKTIMEMYLNVIYLGQGCRGVRSAAATYFGKELEMLTIAEAASLISITNNPSLFDPYSTNEFEYNGQMTNGFQRNRMRQEIVLGEMLRYEFITEQEYREAMDEKIVLKAGIDDEDRLAVCPNESCGYKTIVRNLKQDGESYYCTKCNTLTPVSKSASQGNYSWFTDAVLRDVAQDMAKKNGVTWNDKTQDLFLRQIQTGGYHIYITLDKKVQDQVDAIYSNLEQIPGTRGGQQLQSAIVVIDNRTGDIVALAGGVGEKTGYFEYCRATRAELQSGSSIKPITIYAPAFEAGAITPATVIDDLPVSYSSGPYPFNDDRRFSYSRTIFSAVTSSVNACAAQTLMKIGMQYSFEFARDKFHISTLVDSYVDSTGYEHTDIAVGPLALGAQTWGVHVSDMAAAFATFANNGVYREARTYTKVYDSDGNLVLDNVQESEQILSEKTVNYMNLCLVNATMEGTGYQSNLRYSHGITTAGKTGTTGDSKDRWYCGFTGYYTAAVWTGYDEPEVISSDGSWSGNPACILWKKVMGPLHEGKENKALYDTSGMVSISVCLDSGMLATEACQADVRSGGDVKRVASAMVHRDDVPGKTCNKHVMLDYCSGGGVATEYCQSFAAVDTTVKIEKKSLVKLTQSELDEILRVRSYRIYDYFLLDNYVYMIKDDGKDGVFKGFNNNINTKEPHPYMVCPVHTKEAWEAFAANQQPQDPTAPTEPQTPTNPQAPVTP